MTTSATELERVSVRSYRLVLDQLERRLFKVDRYRLPLPYGVPLRSILYFFVTLSALAVMRGLPLVGQLLGLLPPTVVWLALPLGAAIALTQFQIDGRPPHRVALAFALYRARPRALAGLRRAPREGTRLAPVLEIATRPTGGKPAYVPGRIRGPAEVVVGYPAALELERLPVRARRADREERLRSARRMRLRPLEGARPLVVGQLLHIPEGRELIVDAPVSANGAGASG